MKERLIKEILQVMQPELTSDQLELLEMQLSIKLHDYDIAEKSTDLITYNDSGMKLMKLFLSTKRVEGCSIRTINYYNRILEAALLAIGKEIQEITTNDLRYYLAKYKRDRRISNITLDNMRRIFSSFFGWLMKNI